MRAGRRSCRARAALGRRLDAVVDAVADHVHERLADLVDDRPCPRACPRPRMISSICLPCWRARSRTSRGKRSNTCRIGSIRMSMIVSWSWVDDAGDLVHCLDQLAAARRVRPRRARSRAELLELGAVDDQLTHQVQQVVELREVDAHQARAGRAAAPRPGATVGSQPSGCARGRRRQRPAERRAAAAGAAARERRPAPGPGRGASRGRRAGRLDGVAQRGRAREQACRSGAARAARRAVARRGEHVLEPVDVVLRPTTKPIMPLLPFKVCSGPSTAAHDLRLRPVALQAQQDVIEDVQCRGRPRGRSQRARRRPRSPSAGAGVLSGPDR